MVGKGRKFLLEISLIVEVEPFLKMIFNVSQGNGAVQSGMPYRYYHGKTGRVYNVTKRALGVIVNKKIKGKILAKR